MRLADILGLALSALWQQKMRTLLTMLGVVFGSFVLAASLSINHGVQETIDRESHRSDFLRRIDVWPERHQAATDAKSEAVQVQGDMSQAKRERLRQALLDFNMRFRPENPRVAVTAAKLKALERIDHVTAAVPLVYLNGFAVLNGKDISANVVSARPDNADGRKRLLAGRFFETPGERIVVVSEFFLYRAGIRNDSEVAGVLGKKLRLEFRGQKQESAIGLYLTRRPGQEESREEVDALEKVKNQLPAALDRFDLTAAEKQVLRNAIKGSPVQPTQVHVEEFTIVGVLRLPDAGERERHYDPMWIDGDIVLPVETATDLFFRVPGPAEIGIDHAVVYVDDEKNVKEVAASIKALGLQSRSSLEFIERERFMYLMIFGAMTCVAAIALLVAALGIANTMLMSVLERTREVGIMKAVGAANSHVQAIFLVEGMLIGLVGGGLGLLLAWAASFPGDAWVLSMVQRDLKIELKESLFVFPFWLALTVLLFAMLVTTLAAVYPARRAARVDPVAALRHE